MTVRLRTHSPDETAQVARAIAARLGGGELIALSGHLGAGKTCFIKGLAHGLGIDADRVTSPTFVLVNEYEGRLHVYHIDAYRLRGAEELEALGCHEMFASGAVCVVEWADRVEECLPRERLSVHIEHAGPSDRIVTLAAEDPRHRGLLEAVQPMAGNS